MDTSCVVPVLSYSICSTPRCGGGLLGALLRSSGVAGRPEEYVWRGDMPQWREHWEARTDEEYLAAALRNGSTDNGVFGARVMWAYLGDVVAFVASATGRTGPAHDVLASAFPAFASCSSAVKIGWLRPRPGRRPNRRASGTQATSEAWRGNRGTTLA